MRKFLCYTCSILLLTYTAIPGYAAEEVLVNFLDFYTTQEIDSFDATIYEDQDSTNNEILDITLYDFDTTQENDNKKPLFKKTEIVPETIYERDETLQENQVDETYTAPQEDEYGEGDNDGPIYLEEIREERLKSIEENNLNSATNGQSYSLKTLKGPTGALIGTAGKFDPTKIEKQSTGSKRRTRSYTDLIGPSGDPIHITSTPRIDRTQDANPSGSFIGESVSGASTPTSTVIQNPSIEKEKNKNDQDRKKKLSSTSFNIDQQHRSLHTTTAGSKQAKAHFAQDTKISSSFGKISDSSQIGLEDNALVDQNIFGKQNLGSTMLGGYDDHLLFSKPVLIEIPIDESIQDGTVVEVLVYHLGEEKYTPKGLTQDPNASCYTDGTVSSPEHYAIAKNGYASIYTCGASIFVVTYTGGATSDNFVDDTTITKTITVATGDVTSGVGSVIVDLTVDIDFHSIDGLDETSPGTGNSYSSEFYITMTSPSGTEVNLLEYFTYSNGIAPRVTVTFDDAAGSLPSGTPVSGTFKPADLLSAFDNENPIGDWTFTIGDAVYDDGVIIYGIDLSIDSDILCGNGSINDGEGCDDSNTISGDGCSNVCIVEDASACNIGPIGLTYNASCESGVCDQNETTPTCEAAGVCGNGLIEGAEECDDGNTVSGDGCSNVCVLTYCGNGMIDLVSSSFETIMNEDFETLGNGTVSADGTSLVTATHTITYNNNGANSRLRYGNAAVQTNGGIGAATLDVSTTATDRINFLTFEIDLSASAASTDLELSFDRADHGDEADINDRVWIRGSNTDTYIEVYNRNANDVGNGVYQSVSGIDIDAELTAGGQTPSSTFQVRFGQDDNRVATSATASDGLSIDNVQIVGTVPDGPLVSETCDDGNSTAGDGCSSTCQVEAGYTCTGEPSVCIADCNDTDLLVPLILTGVDEVTQTINFNTYTSHAYTTVPIVLATPQTDNSTNNYPIPVISNVTTGSFDISICLDAGATTCAASPNPEDIALFIVDIDKALCLDNVEAGTGTIATNGSDTAFSFDTAFTNEPYVFTTPQTSNQGGNIAATAWVDDNALSVNGGDFVGCVHQHGAAGNVNICTAGQPNETIGRLAVDPTLFSYVGFDLGTQTIANSTWTNSTFSTSYTSPPGVMVTQNSDNGGQDPQYAWARNVGTGSADIRYCEADASQVCNTHTNELVRWFSLEVIDCGNGVIGAGESCDDGNMTNGDGCDNTCSVESGYSCTGTPSVCVAGCGDGMVVGDEECDDSNTANNDGCNAICLIETGYSCTGEPSTCTTGCGDGIIAGSEECDDNNSVDGDGCNDSCEVESGYSCTGTPSVCSSGCGDGNIVVGEECDDGNLDNNDGCSDSCAIEAGYICPSSITCGNGTIDAGEQCDDGGTVDGDGCSQYCIEEFNFFLAEFTGESLIRDPIDGGGGLGEPIRSISGSGYEATVSAASNPLPHVFYAPFNFWTLSAPKAIELAFQGASDDDFVGYVFGFEPGDWNNPNADFHLITWKDVDQNFNFTDDPIGGGIAQAGLSVVRVQGEVSYDELWQHIDSPNTTGSVTELARGDVYGNVGYRPDLYDTSVFYDEDELNVYVEGVLDISLTGDFDDGRFGIFVFAQAGNTFALGRPHPYALGGGCYGLCGDGIEIANEDCDDGNTINGDGCNEFCSEEGIDECALGLDKCNSLETCIDSYLGYECICEIADCSGGTEPPVIGSGDVCIEGPSSFAFTGLSSESYTISYTGSLSGYFEVSDEKGIDSGWYTTLQITDLSGSTETISNSFIEWKSDTVTLLSGTANPNVVIGSGFSGYNTADSILTYLKRDPGANGGITGTYGTILDMRISLPAYTRPDNYTATICYTLYEN